MSDQPPSGNLTRAQSVELARRRRSRNWVVLLALLGLALLFYAISIVKMGGQ